MQSKSCVHGTEGKKGRKLNRVKKFKFNCVGVCLRTFSGNHKGT